MCHLDLKAFLKYFVNTFRILLVLLVTEMLENYFHSEGLELKKH